MSDLNFLIESPPRRMDVLARWIPRLLVSALFVLVGASKLGGAQSQWHKLFEQIGLGQWFRYFTGLMQILGGLLLLTPWTLTLGAGMLACTMLGAAYVDAFVLHAPGVVLLPLILLGAVTVVWLAGRFA